MTKSFSFTHLAVHYGLLSGLFLILTTLLLYLSGLDKNNLSSLALYAILLGVISWAVMDSKSRNQQLLTFSEAFRAGFHTSLTAIMIQSFYFFIHISYIDRTFVSAITKLKVKEMKEKGLSESDIKTALEFTDFMMQPPVYAAAEGFNLLISSLVFSLIVAGIFKNNKD
jgi:TRAP-type C4-dicarboxylate transport system permease large subunit